MKMDFEMRRTNITKAQFNAEIRCKLKGTILETWRGSIMLETATLAAQPNWMRGTEPYHSHHMFTEDTYTPHVGLGNPPNRRCKPFPSTVLSEIPI
jgi:hypothetical protein